MFRILSVEDSPTVRLSSDQRSGLAAMHGSVFDLGVNLTIIVPEA